MSCRKCTKEKRSSAGAPQVLATSEVCKVSPRQPPRRVASRERARVTTRGGEADLFLPLRCALPADDASRMAFTAA